MSQQAGVVLLAVGADQFVLLLHQGGQIEGHGRGPQAWIARVGGSVDDVSRSDQILGGQAAPVEAGSSQRALFCHHHALAQFRSTHGGGKSG